MTAEILSMRLVTAAKLWLGILRSPLTAAVACANLHFRATCTHCIADSPFCTSWGYMAAAHINLQLCADVDVTSSDSEPTADGLLQVLQCPSCFCTPARVCLSLSVHCPSGPCSDSLSSGC